MIQTAVIFLSFAFLHSITVSIRFKHSCLSILGETFMRAWYRLLYNAVSIATFIAAFMFISALPDQHVWIAPLWLQWPLRGIQVAGLAFGMAAFAHQDVLEFMGVRQVWRYLARRETTGNIEGISDRALVTTGVYGIVRHPMYVAGIVIVTFSPAITQNSLVLALLADLYFLFGMFIEERRFLKSYGDEYRRYRGQVPRMIPRCPWRRK